MSKEQLYSHVQVKDEFMRAARSHEVGTTRSLLGWNALSNDGGRLEPARWTFVSRESFDRGRAQEVPGQRKALSSWKVSLTWSSVISDSSVRKDTIDLRTAYWEGHQGVLAGGRWRGELQFDILRRTAALSCRSQAGRLGESAVLGKSFCLTREVDDLGREDFTLSVR
jgi:hypothetical protein